jgi:hypothetical protein
MSHGNNHSTQSQGTPGRTTVFFRRVRHRITSTRMRVPLLWWRHLGLKPEDVFLGCYPRSGSTWLRFTLFEILTGRPSSFDSVNAAFRGPGDRRRGWPLLPGQGRFMGTHEPYRPSYRKAVYLVRDVRDVALSEFAFERNLGVIPDDFDVYLEDMLEKGKRHGRWQDHVSSWLDSPLVSNGDLLLIRYEDLRKNSVETFMKLATFLGVRTDRDAVERAIANNSVQRMREKEDRLYTQENYAEVLRRPLKGVQPGGRFIRSGKIGGWQDKLSPEQLRFIEERTASVLRRLQYPVMSMDADATSAVPASVGSRIS